MPRARPLSAYIAGRWRAARAPDGSLVSRSPADLSHVLGEFPFSKLLADEAVEIAQAAQAGWAATPLEQRVHAVRKLRAQLYNRREAFAERLAHEVGKPLWEAREEAALLASKVDVTLADAMKDLEEVRPQGLNGRWRYRPHGVLLVLGPFNFPAHLPNGHIVPALLAGNTVLFKPSDKAPSVGTLYAEAADEADLPRGVFGMVQGDANIGAHLAAHRAVNGVLFTGSYAAGLEISRSTIEQPGKLLALEMGGKNAAIVLDDADLEQAAAEVFHSAFVTAGQRCSSTSRVIVHRKAEPAFLGRLLSLVRRMRVGHPLEDVFMGPLIDARARDRFLAYGEMARVQGAEALIAPRSLAPGRDGYYVGASVHRVLERRADSAYQRDEIFGPDLAVYRAKDLDEAIMVANDSDFGLCAAVFTESEDRFEKAWMSLRAGVVNWNRGTVGTASRLPFGGLGRSGNHRPAGIFSVRYCAHPVASIWPRPEERDKPRVLPGLNPA